MTNFCPFFSSAQFLLHCLALSFLVCILVYLLQSSLRKNILVHQPLIIHTRSFHDITTSTGHMNKS